MLKVECEACRAPYQVDERRVPASGLKMRCPKCGHSFVVRNAAHGDADLPAPKVDAELPQAKAVVRAPGPPRVAPPAKPAPAAAAFGDIDLPAVPGGIDLPAPKVGARPPMGVFGDIDLPATPVVPPAVTPVVVPAPPAATIQAATSRRLANDFSGLDLPSLAGGGVGLPQVASVGLPAPAAGLPSPMTAGLPIVAGAGLPARVTAGLPAVVSPGLPVAAGNLPAVAGNLPAPASALPALQGSLPATIQAGLPARAFGALDLPSVGGPGLPSGPAELPVTAGVGSRAGDFSFGELDLPLESPQHGESSDPSVGAGHGVVGGTSFGDLELDGAPAPRISLGPSGHTAPLATEAPSGVAAAPGAHVLPSGSTAVLRPKPQAKPRSNVPRVIGGVIALVVIGGAALQLTPVGAFGHVAIIDAARAGEYKRVADADSEAARRSMGADVYSQTRAAVEKLEAAHKQMPRARALTAYTALAEFSTELRFGADPMRAARARGWLMELPASDTTPVVLAAQAARDAGAADVGKARKLLLDAQQKAGNEPIREDIALCLGELELAAKDGLAAKAAFERALAVRPSARAHFGIARAAMLGGDYTRAEVEVKATLDASPTHPGARTLRARLLWDTKHDDAQAMADVAWVVDGAGNALTSKSERSTAFATRGWILLGRDRAGEARQAFQEAVTLDGQNPSALLGNAEILCADGRYTEAMTRFDEAYKKDPRNVGAIIGAAKTKLLLERVQDARTLLQAARTEFPRDARVALWLGRVLEAQGEKKAAEQAFQSAVALADPKSPDAVTSYASLAHLQASQGRVDDVSQTLALAKAKLPATPALERAQAEVAATQGKFDDAVGHFESALAMDPTDLAARFRLGVTYRRMKKPDLASVEFEKVLAADKEYPGLALERGLLFEESGDVQKALEQFKSALDKAPNDLDLQLRVGSAYVASNRAEDALPLLRKVLDQRPNSAEANHFMGRAYLKKGGSDVAQALRYLQRAVEVDPNRAEYHAYVAWAANAFVPAAKFGLAREEADRALAIDKLSADAYWQRGWSSCGSGGVEDGVKDIRHALELRPSRYEAHASLALCLDQKNDLTGALAEWNKAVQGDQARPEWQYRLGKLELERASKTDAAKHLAFAVEKGRAASIRPAWLIDAEFLAASALHKTGKKAEAAEHYKAFLAIAPPSSPDRRDAVRALRDLGEPTD